MSDEEPRVLPAASPWTGDEHHLQLAAAAEAGLPESDVALRLFTEGFSRGMILDDRLDHAIVIRGRTVLGEAQLATMLGPVLKFVGVPIQSCKVAVHDGEFQLRVPPGMTAATGPALGAAKLALGTFVASGAIGLLAWTISPVACVLAWGIGLMAGGFILRRGIAASRHLLAARLAVALGLVARDEQLVLPPGPGTEARTEGGA